MTPAHSDAFVFFGATGDLAYKMIFPALQALIRRGRLDDAHHRCRQVGLGARAAPRAGAGQPARARGASTSRPSRSSSSDCATSTVTTTTPRRSRRFAPPRGRRPTRSTIWPFPRACSASWSRTSAAPGCDRGARVIVEKPFGRDLASAPPQRDRCTPSSTSRRSFASTTISARKPCRTSWSSASPTPSSSRSGTGTTSRACRSPWPRPSASRGAAASTTRSAPSATSCRTT